MADRTILQPYSPDPTNAVVHNGVDRGEHHKAADRQDLCHLAQYELLVTKTRNGIHTQHDIERTRRTRPFVEIRRFVSRPIRARRQLQEVSLLARDLNGP